MSGRICRRNDVKRISILCAVVLLFGSTTVFAQRTEISLEKGWKFSKGDFPQAAFPDFDDSEWENVTVPHDWAITGPFDREIDLQEVAVTQNLEKEVSLKTGRTGGLPYIGTGWYRRTFDVPEGKTAVLLFDGAMSEARVYVNGKEVCYWPYGYNSFWCDITSAIVGDGSTNTLAVRLENKPYSSRWYPGAGLYRHVHLIITDPVHIPVWGTHVTTSQVGSSMASVDIETKIAGPGDKAGSLVLKTEITDGKGSVVSSGVSDVDFDGKSAVVKQSLQVREPSLWSVQNPALYKAVSKLFAADGTMLDEYETVFGIRSIEYIPYKGFFLNGERTEFKGVCNHHDLGPLGAAVNVSALRHQLELLKDMGCNAVRTTHNMPAPELVRLCDEMGFMMMVEPFDEWDIAKCKNGYHRFFGEWAERDMVNMLHNFRNSPSVVMWSIGNEVPTQCSPSGYEVASFLQDICHREDPTRPVTCGMDQVDCILSNGFADMIDIPGINYRTFRYKEVFDSLSKGFVLGSETASTVSSRGEYKLPVMKRYGARYDDHQCSAYDVESCGWSNIPDVDLALAEDCDWLLGQFVWTGFDYLGEPSPYDTDSWPNHSSMFGIIDLASIPKDRYYLYRSVWQENEPTLHVLPHWNWAGHEGENVPVFVYTSWPEAELFINGKSFGRQKKSREGYALPVDSVFRSSYTAWSGTLGDVNAPVESRFRLMWPDVVYEPGEIRVVAYDADGKPVQEKTVRTAGEPCRLVLDASRDVLAADGKDLCYITVSVVDKDGNFCPLDERLVTFNVTGAGTFKAAANGDPTSLDPFHIPQMHLFNGKLTVIVSSSEVPGSIEVEAHAAGLASASLDIESR